MEAPSGMSNSEQPGIKVLGGKSFDTSKMEEWSPDMIMEYQMLFNQELARAAAEPEAVHESASSLAADAGLEARSTEKFSVSEIIAGLLSKGGLTPDDASKVTEILARGSSFKESFSMLSKSLQALQHVPADAKITVVPPSRVREFASVPAYDLDTALRSRANVVLKMEMPSRAYKIACERLANRAYLATPEYANRRIRLTLPDDTVLYFYCLELETDHNVRHNASIISRYSTQPVTFFKVNVEKAARYMLNLHPCRVDTGRLVPYDGQQMAMYMKRIDPSFIETTVPVPLFHKEHRDVHAIFIQKLAQAKPHEGDGSPLRHVCILLHELGISEAEGHKIALSVEKSEGDVLFQLPVPLGDDPDRLRKDAPVDPKKMVYGPKQLQELNPLETLRYLAEKRLARDPGQAAGIDLLADPATYPFDLYESQTATAYKVMSPAIDLGVDEYLVNHPDRGVAFIGLQKGPELSYLGKWVGKNRVFAYDKKPSVAYGFPVNYIDVLKRDEACRLLEKMGGLFFDVSMQGTGKNTDSKKVLTDCSFAVNSALFASMCAIIHTVRPDMFTLKTFLPPFEFIPGELWPGFKELYAGYDLQFTKRGKLHSDEYTIMGRRRAKPRSEEELLEGRKWFFCQWRAIAAITRAGNVVASYCVATGRSRLVFEKKKHKMLMPDGNVGTQELVFTTPLPAHVPVSPMQVSAFRALDALLHQCEKWHDMRKMELPFLNPAGTSEHIKTEHAVETYPDFDF